MLKELLTAFRKDSLLDKAFRQSSEMLDISKEMFLKAKGTLRRDRLIPLYMTRTRGSTNTNGMSGRECCSIYPSLGLINCPPGSL